MTLPRGRSLPPDTGDYPKAGDHRASGTGHWLMKWWFVDADEVIAFAAASVEDEPVGTIRRGFRAETRTRTDQGGGVCVGFNRAWIPRGELPLDSAIPLAVFAMYFRAGLRETHPGPRLS